MHTHTRRRTRLGAAITTLALLAVGSPTVQAAPAPDVEPLDAPQVRAPVPDIAWQACEGEGLDAFDCASVQVPTDYDRPRGRTTTIALTRLPATDPEQRIGSLFVNFGGPGIAGVQTMHTLGETFLDPQVHAQFDVLGFDPRGVGLSDPVTCLPDEASEKAFLADNPVFPTTPRENAQFLATYGAFMVGCKVLSGNRARLQFRGRRLLFAVMLVTIMIPIHVVIVPQYVIFSNLGWLNTFAPLIVPKLLATDAFFVFLMVQFLRGLPTELDEAARLDGCGHARTFLQVLLPLMVPALATTAIFTFIWTWNDFFSQLIFLTDPAMYTVPVALQSFVDSTAQTSWGSLFAMSVVSLVPLFLIFLVGQRFLIKGIATTGIK